LIINMYHVSKRNNDILGDLMNDAGKFAGFGPDLMTPSASLSMTSPNS